MKKLFAFLSMYRGLPRSIYVLFFARIVNAVGSFVYPFLTMFLTQKLNLSAGEAGMYILFSGISFIPGSFLGGKLADVIGRKRVMVLGQFLSGLFFIPCAFLGTSILIPWLIIFADFFIGMTHPANQAMATDLSTPETRKATFSLLYLGHNIGFAVGPLIAGFLFNRYVSLIFLGDAATTFISVLLVLLLVTESKPSEERIQEGFADTGTEKAEQGSLLKALWTRPVLVVFVLIVMVLNFVYAQMTFSLPLQLMELFNDRGPALYGSIMTFNALVVIIFTTVMISLLKKVKPVLNVMIAGILYACGFGMIYYLDTIFLFFLSTFIWTIGEIIGAINSEVYIANHTPISHRGRFNSVLPVLTSVGFVTGPAVMGAFIEQYSVRAVWSFSFFLALAGAAALIILYLYERSRCRGKTILP
jgi:MFS family permease